MFIVKLTGYVPGPGIDLLELSKVFSFERKLNELF